VILLVLCQMAYEVTGAPDEFGEQQLFWMSFAESFITGFFLLEWMLRVTAYGCRYFRSVVNLIDTIIVWVVGVGIIWLWTPLIEHLEYTPPTDLDTAVRLVRLARLLRVLSAMKNLPMMDQLWMIVRGLFTSSSTFLAACLLIAYTIFFFGMAGVEFIGKADFADASALAKRNQEAFWGLSNSMFTLTRVMQGDDALSVIIALLEQQPFIWIFFGLFIACTTMILLNLLTAVVCTEAFDISKADEEELGKQMKEKRAKVVKEMEDIFRGLDIDHDGEISLDEFAALFDIPGVRGKLARMGLPDTKLVQLFNLLDVAEEGSLDVQDFIQGVQEFEGNAMNKDLLLLDRGVDRVKHGMHRIIELREEGMKEEGEALQELKVCRTNIDRNMHDTEENLHTLLEKMSLLGTAQATYIKAKAKAKRKPPKKIGASLSPLPMPVEEIDVVQYTPGQRFS